VAIGQLKCQASHQLITSGTEETPEETGGTEASVGGIEETVSYDYSSKDGRDRASGGGGGEVLRRELREGSKVLVYW